MLCHGIISAFRGGVIVHLFYTANRHRASHEFRSGHAIAYRWRSLPRVRRHKANRPQDRSSNGCSAFSGIAMDQLMRASHFPHPPVVIIIEYSCQAQHVHDQALAMYVCICMYVCVCVLCFLPIHSGHQVRWTYQPGSHRRKVTQEEGHTGFLIHLPSAVRALIFVARRIQPFLSLVDREVEFCVLTN